MKRTLILFFLVGTLCTQAQTRLNLISAESKVVWKGHYGLSIVDGHHGVIEGVTGSITIGSDGKIQKGEFTLDISTIKVLDMETEKGRNDLAEHLKSDDFFAVGEYPKGFFSILTVTYGDKNSATIDGFLSLKGVSNKVSIPVSMKSDGKSIQASGSVTINRTKWNINHQSASIFGNLKDDAISDDVVIELDLRFR